MRLAHLAAAVEGVRIRVSRPDADPDIESVVHDTRADVDGSLFCCVRGTRVDGHDLAPAAVAAGAAALLVDHELPVDVPQIVVDDVRAALGPVADAFWGHPSRDLTVVGVTGTSGKTTTTHLLASIFTAARRPCGVIGTLSGARTTPEAPELQALLADHRRRGDAAVAMEVSSHGLDQGRVAATRFAAGVFTNLSQDHLDYHGTMDEYFRAKARLFTPGYTAHAVVCTDDTWGERLAAEVTAAGAVTVHPYALADAGDVDLTPSGASFHWRGQAVELQLAGRFNVRNAVGAATAAAVVGVDAADIALGLGRATPVPGRFEVVDTGRPFTVLVDYAHKPDALDQALRAARELAGDDGRLTVVFGCGGDRDRAKRPVMGGVAARGADRVLVTSDNPRSERPGAIIDEILAGVPEGAPVEVEPDRRAAIGRGAVRAAHAGDVVLVAGKGHETTQIVGDEILPFDDRVVAREALARTGVDAVPGPRPSPERHLTPVVPLLIAGALSLVASLLGTRYLIDWLRAHRVGQPIHEDVPDGHVTKAGTPTMGGVAIVVAAVIGYAAAHVHAGLVFTRSGVLVMLAIAGAAVVGAFDDWIKVSHERNLGLSKRAKMGGLLLVAVGFAIGCVAWTDVETTVSFTRWNEPGWDLTQPGWVVFAVLLIAATTNAVNLTDGLDGLAAGSSIYAFIFMTVVAFWAFRHEGVYEINHALDLAVIAAAMVGGITGFLWWNAPPAQIFMGDTGSLAIGAGLATLALTLNVQLLLPIVGALFVFETLSVIVQVGSFRVFGRRVFRMAPVHHHFELGGWPETTVIIRFWILAIMSMAVALGLFYADSISAGVLD